MTRPAIEAGVAALAPDVPPEVLVRVRWTSEVESVPPATFGVAVTRIDAGVVIALLPGSPRTRRYVADLVRAFIGPSHAFNRRPERTLVSGDAFADEVMALVAADSLQVLLAPEVTARACLASLNRLLEVDERRPSTTGLAARPLAPILRDFEGAVARGDIDTARLTRDEAWSTGRLTLVNRSFLDTRILAATGDVAAVLEHARRFRIPDLPLPAPVQQDLIDAVGAVVLMPLRDQGVEALIAAFREAVAGDFGAAFRDHRVAASEGARLAWVVHYLAVDPVPRAALAEVIDAAPHEEQADLHELIHGVSDGALGVERVAQLQAGGEHAAAFAVAVSEDDLDPEVRADTLAKTAALLDDPVRKAQAVEVTGMPATVEPEAVITSVFASVNDWRSWLEALFDRPDADDARKVLDAGSERWTEAVRATEEDLASWSDHIEALAGEPTLRAAIPRITQAVLPVGPGDVAGRRVPVMLALTYAIAEDPEPGSAGLDAIGDLAESLVPTGLGAGDYAVLVERCEHVYRALTTPPRLARWVVDLVRAVMHEPAPSEQDRDAAIRRFVGTLLPDAQRARPLVKAEVWVELSELIEDRAGLADALPTLQAAAAAQAADAGFAGLAGKTVLIHTLVESAGERAREYLVGQGASRVVVDNSHVGSDRIRDLASRADIVVVASKAAKHAAFEAIRPAAGERLRYASGKGWSSLVSAVGDALRD